MTGTVVLAWGVSRGVHASLGCLPDVSVAGVGNGWLLGRMPASSLVALIVATEESDAVSRERLPRRRGITDNRTMLHSNKIGSERINILAIARFSVLATRAARQPHTSPHWRYRCPVPL